MKIRFCGASSGVTGSCHLLMTGEHQILLDCGQFQGGKAQEAMNWDPFPFEAAEVECVILSHAHIDHCGRLPLLVKRGFNGPIYCTEATADLLEVMLMDSAYIHEKEAEWKNRKNLRAGKPPVEPLYVEEDAKETLKLVKPVLYDQLVELNDDVRFCFNDAGHILGSAITEIWVREEDRETKIVFTGDLGMTDRPILRDPTIIKKADVVIMESTYGSRNHTENAADIRRLIEIILNTTRRGGNVVIPSFAVGRTQELIYQLNRFCSEDSAFSKEMRRIPVYVDSPMATTATEVFRANAQCFDDETRDFILKGDDPLDFEGLHFTRSTQESQQLNFDPSPKVILSASGMCEAGRIRHHLKHNLWNEKSSIVFVGYQAQGTLGRSLVEGVKDVTLFGEEIHVNAEIYNLQGFSGHADQNGLFSWLAAFQKRPAQIFLVHGEEEAKETFGKLIHDKLGYDPVIVRGNSEFELTSSCAELLEQEAAEQAGAAQEDIQRVRNQVAKIHEELEHVMYNANLAVGSQISEEKLNRINNMVQELDRAAISLGAAVGSMDRPRDIKEGENA
ncbi:metallo-beta-lactamase family protein [Eubacterium pyruvativorans]|uniref:Metallo-beta-lactamase family protein n=2 Tax=Eubacterium TaxID=1730 RepID=A0A1I7H4P5_9FIRM|nr:MBL fold metallo-hydrolase [Eubacterium pyruvativorans]SFO21459.1 metallo-beta-lactamase family protein [Eubacterium pyruvativorans]SFU55653.1 metallo-beta-lactamase family protein [Eubacterium pyruvativorans]